MPSPLPGRGCESYAMMAVEKGSRGAFMAWFYFLLKVLYNRKCISEERCATVAEGLEDCGALGELASLHILHLCSLQLLLRLLN